MKANPISKIGPTAIVLFVVMFHITIMSARPSKNPPNNFNFQIFVAGVDTLHTSSIEVKLGSTDGGSDLLQYTFVYDQTSNLPAATAYQRIKQRIILTLGSYTVGVPMYGEYKVIDNNSQVQRTKKFQYR